MSIGDWIDSKQGGTITGYVFGFGASVVIIGALFKIMHWPGAGVILTAGMATEALLFVVTALANPHTVYHWERIYPVLSDETEEGKEYAQALQGTDPMAREAVKQFKNTNKGNAFIGGGNAAASSTASASAAAPAAEGTATTGTLSVLAGADVKALTEKDIEKLNKGITSLSETAEKLAKLDAAGDNANIFAQNMASASQSLEFYNNAQKNINNATANLANAYQGIANDMEVAKEGSSKYVGMVETVNKTLGAANSAYELQLKAIESANSEIENFKNNTVALNKSITSLNDIYGNMLNALA